MASLQKKGESWYCQFMYERQRHTLTIGKVAESEAMATAAKIDYILMRIRQRLLEIPIGVDITTFIEHDGKMPAAEQRSTTISFADLRQRYIDTVSKGSLETSTLTTSKIHLEHLAKTIGDKFSMDKLGLAELQRHVDCRQERSQWCHDQEGNQHAAGTVELGVPHASCSWRFSGRGARLSQGGRKAPLHELR